MPSFEAWGFSLIAALPHSDAWVVCPHCHKYVVQEHNMEELVALAKYTVGWSGSEASEDPEIDVYNSGMVIIECPHCVRKYWFHLSVCLAFKVAKNCPNWPK